MKFTLNNLFMNYRHPGYVFLIFFLLHFIFIVKQVSIEFHLQYLCKEKALMSIEHANVLPWHSAIFI